MSTAPSSVGDLITELVITLRNAGHAAVPSGSILMQNQVPGTNRNGVFTPINSDIFVVDHISTGDFHGTHGRDVAYTSARTVMQITAMSPTASRRFEMLDEAMTAINQETTRGWRRTMARDNGRLGTLHVALLRVRTYRGAAIPTVKPTS